MSQGYYQETGYMNVLPDVPAANETKRIIFSVHYLKGTTSRGKCSSRLTKCSHCKEKREREKKDRKFRVLAAGSGSHTLRNLQEQVGRQAALVFFFLRRSK